MDLLHSLKRGSLGHILEFVEGTLAHILEFVEETLESLNV